MVWYMNFCAPFLPNDPTINFHRTLQVTELMILLLVYMIYHTYYKLCRSEEQTEKEDSSSASSNVSSSQQSSEKSEEQSQSEDGKTINIGIGEKQMQNQSNLSNIQFTTNQKTERINNSKKKKQVPKKIIKYQQCQVNLYELQSFFPIVYGHHGIIMAAAIMYSPYAQQSIACILYFISCIALIIFNEKRFSKPTYGIWMFMIFLNIFIMMSALLEIGQANFDYMKQKCFAEEYIALY